VGASSGNSITKSANANFASVLSGEGNSGTTDGANGAAGSAPTTVLTDPAKPVLDPAKPVDVRQQKQHEQALQAPAATASTSNAADTQQALDIASPVSDAGNTSTPTQQGHRADVPRMPAAHLPLLAASMMKRLDNGTREFTLRLDPAELGRIDVKLEMTADRKVRAVIAAEKHAGLDLADNGLSFSLNDGAGDNQSANGDQSANQPRFKSRQAELGQEAMPEAINNNGPRQAGTHDIWKRARVSISA
jgi:flagellar hook-length control protein FliK